MKSPTYGATNRGTRGRSDSVTWRLSERRSLTPSTTRPNAALRRAVTGDTMPVAATMPNGSAKIGRDSSLVVNRGAPAKLRSRVPRWRTLCESVRSTPYGMRQIVDDQARLPRQLVGGANAGSNSRTTGAASASDGSAPSVHRAGTADGSLA